MLRSFNDPSVFDLLISPNLTETPVIKDLLRTLEQMMQDDTSIIFLHRSMNNYRTQSLLSTVLVSKDTIPEVQHALEEAKKKLSLLFNTQSQACKAALTAVAFQVESSQMNAYSYALPGQRPEIVVTSRIVNVMGDSKALQAVLLHELGHLVYTHSIYPIAMNILIANINDNSIASQFKTKELMTLYQDIMGFFEVTADQVMCCAMHEDEEWAEITTMFARMASGTSSAKGESFFAQLGQLDMQVAEQVVAQIRQNEPHSPPLWRLKLLNDFRRSTTFARIREKVRLGARGS